MEDNYPNLENLTIIKEKYRTKNSVIYLVKNESLNQITILKSISKDSISQKGFEMLKRERDFYSSNLDNTVFPSFIKAHKDNKNLYMEITFIEGVNFSKLLTEEHILNFNNKSTSNFNLYLNFISQIVSFFSILHKNFYCYRDLKLSNIMIDKKLKLFLLDFGFVKKLENINSFTQTSCGTFHMKPPELFLVLNHKLSEYNPFSYDIYSIGVIMYEIYYGKPPFNYYSLINNKDNISEEEYIRKLEKGIDDSFFDKEIDNDLKELIIKCMAVDPKKRPNISEIEKDKLFDKHGGYEKLKKMNENLALLKDSDNQIKKMVEFIEFSGDFNEEYENYGKNNLINDLFANF